MAAGKGGKLFRAVKLFFSPSRNVEKAKLTPVEREGAANVEQKEAIKERKWWSFGRSQQEITVDSANNMSLPSLVQIEEQNKHALAIAVATAAAAEAAVVAAQAAVEVARLTGSGRASLYAVLSREERAAIKIQTAFRGYMARRALRALKGLVRLQALVRGHRVRKHANITLRCMQALVKVQTAVQARRAYLSQVSQESQAIKKELLQRQQLEGASKCVSDSSEQREWNDSKQLIELEQAKLQRKREAVAKRERALAYANKLYRSAPKSHSSMVSDCEPDPYNEWSWLEKWVATQSWESRAFDKGAQEALPKSASSVAVVKKRAQHTISPSARTQPVPKLSSVSPCNVYEPDEGNSFSTTAQSKSSFLSAPSRFLPRCSVAGSSVGDDESLGSYSGIPNYMAITESAKAKSRSCSTPKQRPGTQEKECSLSRKKRWSFPGTEPLISNSGPLGRGRTQRRQVPQRRQAQFL